jgi:hypothetical protein
MAASVCLSASDGGQQQVQGRTLVDSRKQTKSGCTTWNRTEEICHTAAIPDSLQSIKRINNIVFRNRVIPGQRQWWYTWRNWLCILGLLGMSSVEVAVTCASLSGCNETHPPSVWFQRLQQKPWSNQEPTRVFLNDTE